MICTNQTVVSAHPWTNWEKLTFNQSFITKQHQLIKFFCLRIVSQAKKEGQRSWGHLENFWSGEGAETFSDQSKTQTTCHMAVIDTNQWVSLKKVWLFNATPLFNVAWWYDWLRKLDDHHNHLGSLLDHFHFSSWVFSRCQAISSCVFRPHQLKSFSD